MNKPILCLAPVNMKMFWSLYPKLEQTTLDALERVKEKLAERFELICLPLSGTEEEAAQAVKTVNTNIDLLAIWECGYVASAIPMTIIRGLKNTVVTILITQRDDIIPEDMDYPRYMESTALTSAMELGGVLKRSGMSYRSFIGQQDDDHVYKQLWDYAIAVQVQEKLRRLVMGNYGYPYPGMLDICVDEAGVAQLGITMKRLSVADYRKARDEVSKEAVESFLSEINEECDTSRVTHEDLARTAYVYRTLESLVNKYRIGALAVHDFECLSMETETVSECALGFLENRYGLAVGVEGDVPNTISAYIARCFSGHSPMFVDWTMFDQEKNAIFFQHNGKADPAIVQKPILSPSAEPFGGVVGDGVVFEASGREGDVTLLSMIYLQDGWHMFAAEGKALPLAPRPCRLNQMTVTLDFPVRDFLASVCDMGLGHHLNIAYGHFAKRAEELCLLTGITYHTITN